MHTYESDEHSMPAPLPQYSVTCADLHIRDGLAINDCPSTFVFSHLCSRTHTSWASNPCLPLDIRIQCLVLMLTESIHLYWYTVCVAPTIRDGLAITACPSTFVFSHLCMHTYDLGQQSMHAPPALALGDLFYH